VTPQQITAYVGDNVTMYCNTTLVEAVDCRRKLRSADRFEIFCYEGSTVKGHEDKFSISSPQSGSYVVLIRNVQLNDSGEYQFIEGVDDPHYGTVVLSVSGNHFDCFP